MDVVWLFLFASDLCLGQLGRGRCTTLSRRHREYGGAAWLRPPSLPETHHEPTPSNPRSLPASLLPLSALRRRQALFRLSQGGAPLRRNAASTSNSPIAAMALRSSSSSVVAPIVVLLALVAEPLFHPAPWMHLVLWIPTTILLSLALLPPVQGDDGASAISATTPMRDHPMNPLCAPSVSAIWIFVVLMLALAGVCVLLGVLADAAPRREGSAGRSGRRPAQCRANRPYPAPASWGALDCRESGLPPGRR